MAESAVCFVIDKLISFLINREAKISRHVHQEISCIRDELESIRSFLRDADARAAREGETFNIINQTISSWVKQVREAAYHIEDVIDEDLLRITRKHQDRGFIRFLRKVTWVMQQMKPKHQMASKIDVIRTLVRDIKARSLRYDFNSAPSNGEKTIDQWRWHDPRVASLFIEEAEVVGFESARDELISWIVQGSSSSSSTSARAVISVVGMGGLGKTTLAKKVYDNKEVVEQFDCYAWITVSQLYKMEDVLRMMIKQFYKARIPRKEYAHEGVDPMNEESLTRKSREYLQEKRYVVLFDDVWNVDFWGAIEHALPDNDKGCRIMITTRSRDVADFCKKSCFVYVHYLQPLPPNKAWELFCRKAFQFDQLQGNCPPELKELSLEIVKKCGGLPLAIVSIGGLLSTKAKAVYEWRRLYNSLSFELGSNPHLSSLTRILSLSYHHLPYYLKSCVLYFGIFPEDYSISCARLVRLWIAEGFVKVTKGKTLEEVAEGYLTELIHRSLVEVSRVYIDGKARNCRVHDLLRELLLKKAVDSSFCHVLSEDESTFKTTTRRLSIDCDSNSLGNIHSEHSNIRSLFAFNQDECPKNFLNTMSGNFKLLKVVDFSDAPVQHLPKYVGSLYYLRYLSVRNTKVKLLPKSIGKLQNLETLDLIQSLVCEIPAKLNRLLKLRNILASYCDYSTDFSISFERGVKINDGVGCLSALQKLYHVDVNHGGISLIQALGKLTQLRCLGLKNLKSTEDGHALCASIGNMNHLESLEVCTMSEDDVLHVQSISTRPEFIRFLYLKGCLKQFPSWISKLQHLVKIRFFWSRLRDDPLKALQNLPNLIELGLSYEAYDRVQLHFAEGGFQKLKLLKLRDLKRLESVIIDNGVMPLLQELQLGPSPQLKEVPSGIHHLRILRTLIFVDMPEAFRLGIDDQHYWVVDHVREVFFSYKFGPRCGVYETHKLQDPNGTPTVKFVKAYR